MTTEPLVNIKEKEEENFISTDLSRSLDDDGDLLCVRRVITKLYDQRHTTSVEYAIFPVAYNSVDGSHLANSDTAILLLVHTARGHHSGLMMARDERIVISYKAAMNTDASSPSPSTTPRTAMMLMNEGVEANTRRFFFIPPSRAALFANGWGFFLLFYAARLLKRPFNRIPGRSFPFFFFFLRWPRSGPSDKRY